MAGLYRRVPFLSWREFGMCVDRTSSLFIFLYCRRSQLWRHFMIGFPHFVDCLEQISNRRSLISFFCSDSSRIALGFAKIVDGGLRVACATFECEKKGNQIERSFHLPNYLSHQYQIGSI